MTGYNLFKLLLEKVKFRFIPVYDLKNDSIYGYKIAKDFDEGGYTNKEEVYDLAFDEGILEFFLVKLQEKAYQTAEELGYKDCRFFHTLRVNYIDDTHYFSSATEMLISKFNLKKENIIFELKGAYNWKNVDKFLEAVDPYDDSLLMFKESSDFPLNQNMIHFLEPAFIEAMTLTL